ncbi:MAG: antitoxin [Rhodanobacteraceae bacterium]|nr:MAG: antitoxin [Rhodanobacteraceae bacterium]
MRTTITLEPDVEALLKRAMRERGVTFKDAVNQAVRAGLNKPVEDIPPFKQRAFHLGAPLEDLTKALALADELDDITHGWVPRG